MINRDNYEEFFLLYVDGELDATQRKAVEEFVLQNADLQPELEMLQEAVLLPEPVSFNDKESLYKRESGITANNYEEYFLLSVDNELNKNEQAEVERFVLQNPKLQEEYTLLHQTKLPAEAIPHPNKEELYRRTEERRVIPFGWMKLSAAAAIIIIIAATFLTRNAAETISNPIVTVTPVIKKATQDDKIEQQPATRNVTEPIVIAAANDPINDVAKAQVVPAKEAATPVTRKPAELINKEVANVPVENVPKPKLLPPTAEMMTALIKREPTETATPPTRVKPNHKNVDDILVAAKPVQKDDEPIVKTAVYKEMEEDEESNTIYLGAAQLNKKKIKGLFQKASNLFERKDKDGDDDRTISIASFQFKSK